MPVALEEATKVVQGFLYSGKEYVCLMQIHADLPETTILKVLNEFVGEIYQKPPLRASVKREPRKRWIYNLDVSEIEGRTVLFRCSCQAGTYMRKLCSDVGEVFACGAHMRELRRTRAGPLTENDGLVTLHQLSAAQSDFEAGDPTALRRIIKPMEIALTSLPKVMIRDSAVDAVCHGAELALPGVTKLDSAIERNTFVSIFSLKGEAVALGHATLSSREMLDQEKGVAVKTERVIMERNTYPTMWKH
ncbi:MAG TPA: RNA-guided pseudouridylation complex pseudouridine synthase subunit Cbf5 [Terriglobales bacterium]|nr:RNA-guided pseudouridylation complex pseudouridine synthase subunit Cbf5 [Terriglobales bacterium]